MECQIEGARWNLNAHWLTEIPLKTTPRNDSPAKSSAATEASWWRKLSTRLGSWLYRWVLLTGQLPSLTRDPDIEAWLALHRLRLEK